MVEVVDCPNLMEEPFNLVGGGLGGSPTLLESGGPLNLLPLEDRRKVYNIRTLSELVNERDDKDLLILGVGAGPVHLNGKNCEIIVNMKVTSNKDVKTKCYEAVVEGAEEKIDLKPIRESDIYAYMTNLFLSEGKCGKVLKVYCRKRTGSMNFLESIRLALLGFYKEKCVGLGGIFLMKNGTFIQHLAKNSKQSLPYTFELKTYEMPGPLNAVGTLFSHPNRMGLRVEHFHSFSKSSFGGHYHIDNTPSDVEYEGYFNFAEKVVRADILHFNN
ncbi:C11orf54 family protein [Megaselia abdita]